MNNAKFDIGDIVSVPTGFEGVVKRVTMHDDIGNIIITYDVEVEFVGVTICVTYFEFDLMGW